MIAFLIGLFLGGVIGVCVMALMFIARDDSEDLSRQNQISSTDMSS